MFFIEEIYNNRFIKVEKCPLQCCSYNMSVESGACCMTTLKDSVIIFFFLISSFQVFRTTLVTISAVSHCLLCGPMFCLMRFLRFSVLISETFTKMHAFFTKLKWLSL